MRTLKVATRTLIAIGLFILGGLFWLLTIPEDVKTSSPHTAQTYEQTMKDQHVERGLDDLAHSLKKMEEHQ
jgi:hypothetical protein